MHYIDAAPRLTRRHLITGGAAIPLLASAVPVWSADAGSVSILDFVPPEQRAGLTAGTSEFDCGPAISAALAASGAIIFPAGRYPIASPVRFVPRVVAGRFISGPTLTGAGVGRTVFVNRRRDAAMFEFDSGATSSDFRAITGLNLSGFTIEGRPSEGRVTAIRLRSCFMTRLNDLHIIGMGGDGVWIECRYGDNDGSNMIALERVRIENCAGWGLRAAAAVGANEISFLHLRHVAIQNCGRPGSIVAPTSGGMIYKGQALAMDGCGFTINNNAALYIPGEAGLCINAQVRDTAFENNMGRQLLCTGVSVFRGSNLQFFNNDAYRAAVACEFRGDKNTVREVSIDGVTIRATAGNRPYSAFRFGGGNLEARSCRVSGVAWENFGYPGQTRAEGLIVS